MSSSSRISTSSSHAAGSNRAPQSAPSSKKSRTDEVATEVVQKSAFFRQSTSLFIAEFQFLEMNEVAKAGLTCKTLRTISQKEVIWRTFYVRIYTTAPSQNNPDYKSLVKDHFLEICRKITINLNVSLNPNVPFAENLGYKVLLEMVKTHRNALANELHRFAKDNLLDAVRIILESTEMTSRRRGAAICSAAEGGHIAMIQELLKDYKLGSAWNILNSLEKAASDGHLPIVQALVKYSSNVSDWPENNALINAATNGHLEIIQFLLANVPVYFEEIEKAISIAKSKCHKAIEEILTNYQNTLDP